MTNVMEILSLPLYKVVPKMVKQQQEQRVEKAASWPSAARPDQRVLSEEQGRNEFRKHIH